MIRDTLLAVILASVSLPVGGFAEAAPEYNVISADILPGWQTGSGQHMVALRLHLAPHWKTYWRAPGDAGIPPVFNWAGSQNLGTVKIHWPRPEVFETNGMRSIGYYDELVLPIEVTANVAGQPVMLSANVDLGVCRDICMPASLSVSADLPSAGANLIPDAVIMAALKSQPTKGTDAGMTAISCQIDPISDGLRVTAKISLPAISTAETVVLESGQDGVWVSEATSARDGDQLVATVDMVAGSGAPFALDRSGVTVTVLGTDSAVEIHGCPAA
ncbi:MAG: protein-disulfide reductase DsbD family protein [Paracoccaceae bacterium]|nr:protein-disulfide reductase DsbD family protein [Paracoccaceae bacterium]